MLSILIPTHEYLCDELVGGLSKEAQTLVEETEILVCSDASSASFDESLRARLDAIGDARVRFLQTGSHLGPARTRNLLVRESRGELLLFIDADAQLAEAGFLARHLEDAERAEVVCGALRNPEAVAPGRELRMRYEKAAIFLILIFIVIIISLNIFGSLSMLVIEKQDDIAILRAMGADDRLIRRIFILEGWLISLLGMAVGVVLGVGLALLQQHFGLIKMPGNFVVDAYPVVLRLGDVLLSAAGVALIGLLVALAPRLSRSR